MPSKIERSQPKSQPRPSSVELAAAPARASPATSQAARVPRELASGPSHALPPSGEPLATSADPSALWGSSPREEAVSEFRALSPAQRQARLEEVRGQREDLRARIAARSDALDARWRRLPPQEQAAALGEYERHSRRLDPDTRRELRRMLRQAGEHRAAIASLEQRAQALGTSKADKAEKVELRKELKALERSEASTVQQAVQAVDQQGLRLDRLAETEQLLDPGAAGDSLLSLIEQFVDLSWLADTFLALTKEDPVDEQERHEQKISEERLEHDVRQDRQRKLRALDDLNKFDRAAEDRRAAMGQAGRGRASVRSG